MAAAIRSSEFEEHQTEECASGVHLAARPVFPVFERELPAVPGIDLVPRRIVEEDAADLRWRFGDAAVASLGSSSGMGASLERAESYGYGALPCRRCGGRWRRKVRRDGVEVVIGWRDGTGRMPRKVRLGARAGERPTYAAALAEYRRKEMARWRIVVIDRHPREEQHVRDETVRVFWERGEMVVTSRELAGMYPTLPEELTEPCANPPIGCGGIGVVPRRNPTQAEINCWPKGSSVQLGGREGLDADGLVAAIADSDALFGGVHDAAAYVSLAHLERLMMVERTLADVAGIAPIARLALEELYQPHGGAHLLLGLTPADVEPEARRGSTEAWTARRQAQADDLLDFAGQCWNLCSWGAS
jgi:hypothetical protein